MRSGANNVDFEKVVWRSSSNWPEDIAEGFDIAMKEVSEGLFHSQAIQKKIGKTL